MQLLTKIQFSQPVIKISYSPVFKRSISLLKIILGVLIVVFLTITAVFFLLKIAPGGDAFLQQKGQSEEAKETLKKVFWLDRPIFSQYLHYLDTLFSGSFGLSTTVRFGIDVSEFIWPRIGWSFLIGSLGVLLGLFLALIGAFLVAFKPKGITEKFFQFLTTILLALPTIVLGMLVVITTIGINPDHPILFEKTNLITWFLPILAIALPEFAIFYLIIKAYIKVKHQDQFIKFASIKGLKKFKIVIKHLIPQCLFPAAARIPVALAFSIVHIVFIESIFGIPGVGSLLTNAIAAKDYSVVLSITLFTTIILAFSFKLRDIFYIVLDPRLRKR